MDIVVASLKGKKLECGVTLLSCSEALFYKAILRL